MGIFVAIAISLPIGRLRLHHAKSPVGFSWRHAVAQGHAHLRLCKRLLVGLSHNVIDVGLRHYEDTILSAQDEVAGTYGNVSTKQSLVQGRDSAVIEKVAHVAATAEHREPQAADLGAVPGEAVN